MKLTTRRPREASGERRLQYGALPYTVTPDGGVQILLVTSRETRRWVLPKGWPMKGLKPHRAAAREAYEEAGVLGHPKKRVIGEYDYWKRLTTTFELCHVRVFGLEVDHLEATWPEDKERKREWFDPESAADLVDEPGLTQIIRGFRPPAPASHATARVKNP